MWKQSVGILMLTTISLAWAGQSHDVAKQNAYPLYPTVFLKPGDSQPLTFSAPGAAIGASDRTSYRIGALSEKGEPLPDPKGVSIKVDYDQMKELWKQHKTRFIVFKASATAEAEPGSALMRIRCDPFGGSDPYETLVKVVVSR